jgi:hypothetical protein
MDEMDNMVQRSMRPHCAAESTLMRKKRRLVNWVNNPESVEKDMLHARNALQKAKDGYLQIEADQEQWLESFQTARRYLVGALKLGVEQNKRLKSEGLQLMNLCDAECGYALRKKRTFHAKDLVDELQKRQSAHEHAVSEYVTLAQELHRVGGKDAAPVVRVSVEELHYPEDDVFIRMHHCRASGAVAGDSQTTIVAAAVTGDEKCSAGLVGDETCPEAGSDVPEDTSCDEPREWLSDIPLPYFDHETKEVVYPATVPAAPTTVAGSSASAPATTAEASGPRTRKRSGSISGTIKLEASLPSTTDLETGTSSEAPSSVERTEPDLPSHGTAYSHGNWSPAAVRGGDGCTRLLTEQDLLQLLHATQEAVKLSEGMVTDAEFMFQERSAPIDDATLIRAVLQRRQRGTTGEADVAVKTEGVKSQAKTNGATKHKGAEDARALAASFLSLTRANEHEWSAYLDSLFDGLHSQGIVTRKGKKKGPEFLPISVDVRLRTPREALLVLSPLSQFEDRMVGVLHRDTIYQQTKPAGSDGEAEYTSTVRVPTYLHAAEEEALQRLSLQGAAAIADVRIQRLTGSIRDIGKFAQEAHSALRRAEHHHEVTKLEEAQDLRRMYKELVQYNIVPNPSDEPLSPVTSNSAAIALSALHNSGFHCGGANKAGAKNSRAPVRISSVSQAQRLPMAAPVAVSVADLLMPTVSREDSMGSEQGTTTSECMSSTGSEGKLSEEAATVASAADSAEANKRKATSAGVAVSAPKRRR